MQRPFTDEDFETMISELTDSTNPSFDKLCEIAEKTLKVKVKYLCTVNAVLRGRNMEDDIMQEILIRLIKTTTYGFLIRKDRNGVINKDPDGFKSWMCKVAENIINDTAKALKNRDYRVRGFEIGEENRISESHEENDEEQICRYDRLSKAFSIVIDSDKKIYIVLTWLAQNLFMLEYGITKIKSTRLMEYTLGEKTLYEMRDIILKFANEIDWIVITDDQLEKINQSLDSIYEGKSFGDCKYKEFYMKKGGKKSISDWVNRVNRMIGRLM